MQVTLVMLDNPILISDEEIKEGDWCINTHRLNEYQSIVLPDKVIGKADYTAKILIGSGWNKIIAGIEGLPKLDLSLIAEGIGWVDVEKLAEEIIKEKALFSRSYQSISLDTRLHNATVAAFREGFKAAQSLNEEKYSEEDMIEFCQFHRDYFTQCSTEMWNTVPTVSESFKVWLSKRKPKEYQVEVEMERVRYPKGDDGWEDVYTPKITNNTIKVTKIIKQL